MKLTVHLVKVAKDALSKIAPLDYGPSRKGRQRLAIHSQGHSKNPPDYGPDGVGAVLAEVFAGFGDGETALADQEHDGVAQGCERPCSLPDAAPVLVERDVAHIVKPVLDRPMSTIEFEQALGSGFL